MADKQNKNQDFVQDGIPTQERTLEDFFEINGGTLLFKGIFQTQNFIPNKRGVQILSEGLNSTGGNINGATISGGTSTSTLIANATGVLYGNGANAVTAITAVSGSFYVASSSGGSPTHLVTVTNGVITNIA